MAKKKSTPKAGTPRTVESEPSLIEHVDHLTMKLSQAEALACVMNGGEPFNNYSVDIQNRVLWLLESTLEECRKTVGEMTDSKPFKQAVAS